MELVFKCRNPFFDVTCCRLYSDKPVVLNVFGPRTTFLKKIFDGPLCYAGISFTPLVKTVLNIGQ